MTLDQYIDNINKRFSLGNATEHTFRGDLQQLLESLVPDIRATNEPKRQSCGAPDYILTKKEIPVGFIEAKDIGDKDLEGAKKTGNKEQFDRYKASLNNLIFTDYLDFHLYIDGVFITKIAIAALRQAQGDKYEVVPLPENFAAFTNLIKDFCSHIGLTIKSSKKLAEMMAGKARLLSDVIEKALTSDEEKHENSTLKDQMLAFKQILIHDITPKGFADVYAQTIAYGMFAARLHDPTLPTFSRQEAAELIPKSNPFLRKLFGYIAGPDIDDRIKWIVDSLVEIFLACNVEEILKNYGKSTKMEDPIIHFYETFLSEYDPKLRKARGVWYTPHPVVNFQVRAIDDILKTEFGLPNGLADNSKIKIKVKIQGKDVEQEVHKVQLLDPATGTGTYIAEVIKHIYKKFEGQQGIWSNYVENHLLPRLIGFELLMASYAMAHLQIDLLLKETGFKPTREQRLKIYLTNSLEESHPDTGTLFANWLSSEANEANYVKRDAPVMIVMGNPPYSGISSNNGEWISKLIEDYKYVDGVHFNERKHWLNDDYVKFLRYGQHFIEKNGSGILAFINPHGFLDNPTFRGMRWNLLKTYDKIYTIDLHGNSKKKETAPDGSADVNVFDIMQGVSINIFIKTGKKKTNELGKVFHFDLFGKREMKYDFLSENSLKTVDFNELNYNKPNYFFVPKNDDGRKLYEEGIRVDELFSKNVTGIVTMGDEFAFAETKSDLKIRLNEFKNNNLSESELKAKYNLGKNYAEFILSNKEKLVVDDENIIECSYRPFDNRFTYFDNKILWRWRVDVMKHFLKGENVGLVTARQCVGDWQYIFISKLIGEFNLTGTAGRFGSGNFFPLYLYPETNPSTNSGQAIQQTIETSPTTSKEGNRIPNLNAAIVKQIADKLGLTFVPEKPAPLLAPLLTKEGSGVVANQSTTQAVVTNQSPNPKLAKTEKPSELEKHQVNNLPYLKTFRKELRNNLTPAEAKFWTLVQNSKLEGRKFRRQHSVGNYILDFYCPSEKLAIELDGEVHFNETAQLKDAERTLFLKYYGIKVLRFENKLVFEQTEQVLNEIKESFGWNKTNPEMFGLATNPEMFSLATTPAPPLEGFEIATTPAPPLEGGEFVGELFFAPIDILDYIYAVLHSPSYREKYKEFLKIDFPRVPYPKDKDTFWQLVKLGGEIRQIHLLESPTVEKYITQYPIDGDNVVTKPRFVNSPILEGTGEVGNVYINETQYFANVPLKAWEFYIGGYQPAQKWLKDRKERKLEFDDILHYQKIIVALYETDRLMKEIDKIEIE